MNGIGDSTMGIVEYALRGTAARSEVHSHNIANVNTPNFRAKRVDFESRLQEILARGDVAATSDLEAPSVLDTGAPADHRGNSVDLQTELVGLVKNNLIQDAMVNAYNFKVNVLRTAVGRR